MSFWCTILSLVENVYALCKNWWGARTFILVAKGLCWFMKGSVSISLARPYPWRCVKSRLGCQPLSSYQTDDVKRRFVLKLSHSDMSAPDHARLMVRPCTTGRTIRFVTSCDYNLVSGFEFWTYLQELIHLDDFLKRHCIGFKTRIISQTVCSQFTLCCVLQSTDNCRYNLYPSGYLPHCGLVTPYGHIDLVQRRFR